MLIIIGMLLVYIYIFIYIFLIVYQIKSYVMSLLKDRYSLFNYFVYIKFNIIFHYLIFNILILLKLVIIIFFYVYQIHSVYDQSRKLQNSALQKSNSVKFSKEYLTKDSERLETFWYKMSMILIHEYPIHTHSLQFQINLCVYVLNISCK